MCGSSTGESDTSEDDNKPRLARKSAKLSARKRKGSVAMNHDGTASSAQSSELQIFEFLLKGVPCSTRVAWCFCAFAWQ